MPEKPEQKEEPERPDYDRDIAKQGLTPHNLGGCGVGALIALALIGALAGMLTLVLTDS